MPFITFYDLDLGSAPTDGVDKVQTLTIDAEGGTYTLDYEGEETGIIAFNAEAADIQAELQALATVGEDGFTVTGSAGGPYTITAGGDLSGLPLNDLTPDDTALTGGAGTAVILETVTGVQGSYRGCSPGSLIRSTTGVGFIFQNTGSVQKPIWTAYTPQV